MKQHKKFYIIRHGETDLNKNGIVQGRGINSDLNQTGIAQSNAFFEMYQHIPFDKIYTSKLKRTHQTVAKFITKGITWEQLEGLDELAWGIYEGQKSTPQLRHDFEILIKNWNAGNFDIKTEGGESPNEVFARQQKAVKHILAQANEKTVLICMHGRAMRLLLCLLLEKPLSSMDDFPHQNTSLYILNYDGNKFDIEAFNDLEHLLAVKIG
jgi:broad specificity phosphatase PhoE